MESLMGADNSIVVESKSSQYQGVGFPDKGMSTKSHEDEIDLFVIPNPITQFLFLFIFFTLL